MGLYDNDLNIVVEYTYDSWGNVISITGSMAETLGKDNPFRYRSYYYDSEIGLYYLNSRYYDSNTGRFINADNIVITGNDLNGTNLFTYCNNNPVNATDPSGHACYHWVIAVGIVAGLAVATIVSAGSFAFAMTAFGFAAGGISVGGLTGGLAMATIGSAYALGTLGIAAAFNSNTVSDFNDQGNWGTVAVTAGAAVTGYVSGYSKPSQPSKSITTKPKSIQHTIGVGSPKNNVNINGSYTKIDNNGKLYSYTQFDSMGRQSMRMDFQGRPHAGVLPHTHIYTYPSQGGRVEYIFDLEWNLIN